MDIEKSFKMYAQKIDKVVSEQLKKTGEDILIKSNILAPRDTGLMESETEVAVVSDNRVEVRYNTDYSLYVHENLEANHPNGGQAKFLELSTLENSSKHFRNLKNKIKDIR